MKITAIKDTPEVELRMKDDPRFLTLLAGVAGSSLSQFEVYRKSKQRDYDGDDLIENLSSDEEWRLKELTDRVYFAATLLYQKLTREEPVGKFNTNYDTRSS